MATPMGSMFADAKDSKKPLRPKTAGVFREGNRYGLGQSSKLLPPGNDRVLLGG